MACTSVTLNNINAKCDTAVGGIKKILIANQNDVAEIVVDEKTGVITTITMESGKYFAQWLFRKNTANYSTSMTSDAAIGNTFITTDLNIQFTKAEATKRLEIQSAINAAAVIIIELQDKDDKGNNSYILLGYDNEVTVTSVNQQSGTAMSDLNGYTLTFQDTSVELPHFVEPTIISTLLKANA